MKEPRSFTIPINIGSIHFKKALCDLGASKKLMPLSIYEKLGVGDLKNTQIILPLAYRFIGELEDVLVKVRSFISPKNFVVLDFEEDREIPILLGRPFLATFRSTIDLEKNELKMKINGETETFRCGSYQSEESRRKQGERCHYIFTFESNCPEFKDTLDVINVGLKSRYKEGCKWRRMKGHDR
ncbi:Retrovirus-related Pol polyprotein from transposon opus [Gossypium australe]|uniref:Retrovirus-related Pol polyprotein from transposon opus n=1 Tax=Gossypium australe TaxID=47621 RepID=A0A5B6WQR1_9ROSI|nr:Retrovirus-related Pol polyprotein from transposon opus [Gossypium australe]